MSCVQARLRSEHAPGQAACEKPQRPRPAAARSGPDGRRPAPVRPARRALPAAPGPRGEWREGAAAARGPARPVRSLGGPESPPAIGARLGGRGGRWVRSPGSPEPAEGRCAGRAGGVPRPGLPCGRAGGAPGLGAWGGRVGAGPRWGPGGGVGGGGGGRVRGEGLCEGRGWSYFFTVCGGADLSPVRGPRVQESCHPGPQPPGGAVGDNSPRTRETEAKYWELRRRDYARELRTRPGLPRPAALGPGARAWSSTAAPAPPNVERWVASFALSCNQRVVKYSLVVTIRNVLVDEEPYHRAHRLARHLFQRTDSF